MGWHGRRMDWAGNSTGDDDVTGSSHKFSSVYQVWIGTIMLLAIRCWTASRLNRLDDCRLLRQLIWDYDKNFKVCQGVRIGVYLPLTARTSQASTMLSIRIVSCHLASNNNPDSLAIRNTESLKPFVLMQEKNLDLLRSHKRTVPLNDRFLHLNCKE